MASKNGSERGNDDDAGRAAPPQPLKVKEVHLPDWATLAFEGDENRVPVVDVDADAAYPALLSEMGVQEPDRFWLETAYQFIKLDCQVALRRFAFEIRIHDPEKNWRQEDFPAGKGAEAATFGREARETYRRLRGFVPS
jgi:hypothetical protein